LKGHQESVTSVAFSPDGKTIVSGSFDNTIRLWRGGTWQTWLDIACERLLDHPVLVDPETTLAEDTDMMKVAKAAGKTCQKFAWNPTQNARFLVNQSRAIARRRY
jgi:WD40 repeat protein